MAMSPTGFGQIANGRILLLKHRFLSQALFVLGLAFALKLFLAGSSAFFCGDAGLLDAVKLL